jgi:hypothetical protein
VLLIMLHWATKKDAMLYLDPATRGKISTPLPSILNYEDIYAKFKAQNIWELKLVIFGYISGLLIFFLIWRLFL